METNALRKPIEQEQTLAPQREREAKDVPTLLDEILQETRMRDRLGIFDLDRAAEQAKQRVEALATLQQAAIRSTQPIHWVQFKNDQGQILCRFNHAGAARIAMIFGITVVPDGKVEIKTPAKGRPYAEITGSGYSAVLGVSCDNIRAYRIEGEDFLGRPAEDKEYGSGYKAIGVGDNDWIQSTQTALQSKVVRILSGIITVTPAELARAWGMQDESEVVKKCTMGHGFDKSERKEADTRPISEGQVKRMFGIAGGRIRNSNFKNVKASDVVNECVNLVMRRTKGIGTTTKPEDVPRGVYDAVCDLIAQWTPDTAKGEHPPQDKPDARNGTPDNGNAVTSAQVDVMRKKANEKVGQYPDAGTDGKSLLLEAIIDATGETREPENLTQEQMVPVIAYINNWPQAS